jgi:putative addiction module component (TIGR02574 family)
MEVGMSDQLKELAQRGLALSIEERSRLVDLLIASLKEPSLAEVEDAWNLEIEQRLDEYDQGMVESVAADQVFSKVKSNAK